MAKTPASEKLVNRKINSFFTPVVKKKLNACEESVDENADHSNIINDFSKSVKTFETSPIVLVADLMDCDKNGKEYSSLTNSPLNEVEAKIISKRKQALADLPDTADKGPEHSNTPDPTLKFTPDGKKCRESFSRKKVKTSRKSDVGSTPAKPLAYYKAGKVVFNEKKILLESHPETINELAKFFAHVAALEILPYEFPIEFHSLLAKLVQDSECTKNVLARKIQRKLFPSIEEISENKRFDISVIENAIEVVANRENYGVSEALNGSIWRWEVINLELLPESFIQTLKTRRYNRILARDQLKESFETLNNEEKELLKTAKKDKETLAKVREAERQQKEQEKQMAKEQRDKEKLERLVQKQKEKEEKEEKRLEALKEKEVLRKKKEEKAKVIVETPAIVAVDRSQPKISGFFQSMTKTPSSLVTEIQIEIKSDFELAFPQFPIKPDMLLAPQFFKRSREFDETTSSYLSFCKSLRRLLLVSRPCGVVALDAKNMVKDNTIKLFQFHENYRPGYYGTWNKKSSYIKYRNPFIMDTNQFDYEYDSDEEWEEGDEEGEECLTDEEDEEEEDETLDEDDGWLVPHGYLSDDEGIDQDDFNGEGSPRKKPDDAIPKKQEALIPIVYGPFVDTQPNELMLKFKIRLFVDETQTIDPFEPLKSDDKDTNKDSRKKAFINDMLPQLKEMIDKSQKGVEKLVEEFRSKFGDSISKNALAAKIKEIAVKEKREGDLKACWHVSDHQIDVLSADVYVDIAEQPLSKTSEEAIEQVAEIKEPTEPTRQ